MQEVLCKYVMFAKLHWPWAGTCSRGRCWDPSRGQGSLFYGVLHRRCRNNSCQGLAGANTQKAWMHPKSKTHEDHFCKFENPKLVPILWKFDSLGRKAKKYNDLSYIPRSVVLCKYVFDVCKVKFVMGRNLQLWSLLRPVKRTACRASFHGVLVFFHSLSVNFASVGLKLLHYSWFWNFEGFRAKAKKCNHLSCKKCCASMWCLQSHIGHGQELAAVASAEIRQEDRAYCFMVCFIVGAETTVARTLPLPMPRRHDCLQNPKHMKIIFANLRI